MSGFDRLHPLVQHHIVNSLGWSSLRPFQEEAIAPLVAGQHALLIAPTAGGKTEAAMFPLFSRMLAEDWKGLSVLYVPSPFRLPVVMGGSVILPIVQTHHVVIAIA